MLMFPSVLIMEPVFSHLDVMMKSLFHCSTFVHEKIKKGNGERTFSHLIFMESCMTSESNKVELWKVTFNLINTKRKTLSFLPPHI